MNSLISIIIPTYNRAHLISDTLDSIIAQSYQNWECIIVDDGSTDNTDEVIDEYCKKDLRFHYHKRPQEKRKGPCSCRNYGFELSKGEFINWFDSDDILFENALELRIENFNNDIDCVIAKCEVFDANMGLKLSENVILSAGNILKDYFVGNITYYVSGPIWRRSFLEKQKELFDEKIRYLDDWDFNLRMIPQNPNIKYIDVPVFRYRFHDFSLSKQVNYLNFEELKSEFIARNKQLKLLPKKIVKNSQLREFVLKRYRLIYKESIRQKDKNSCFYFTRLILAQLEFRRFKETVSTIIDRILYYFK